MSKSQYISIRRIIAIILSIVVVGSVWYLGKLGYPIWVRTIVGIGLLICFVIITAIVTSHQKRKLVQKRNKLLPLLYEEGQYDQFISSVKILQRESFDENLSNALNVDLAVAFMAKNEGETASDYIEKVSTKNMDSININIYMINLILIKFISGDIDSFIKLMSVNEDIFREIKDLNGQEVLYPYLDLLYIAKSSLEEQEKNLQAQEEKFYQDHGDTVFFRDIIALINSGERAN